MAWWNVFGNEKEKNHKKMAEKLGKARKKSVNTDADAGNQNARLSYQRRMFASGLSSAVSLIGSAGSAQWSKRLDVSSDPVVLSISGKNLGKLELGLGALSSCLAYQALAKKEENTELNQHEKGRKESLRETIATQLTLAAGFLDSIVGPKSVRHALYSSKMLTGSSSTVIANLFLVGAFVYLGASIARTVAANRELEELIAERDKFVKSLLSTSKLQLSEVYKNLSEEDRETVLEAVLKNTIDALVEPLDENAPSLKELASSLSFALSRNKAGFDANTNSSRNILELSFLSVKEQRHKTNNEFYNTLYAAFAVSASIAVMLSSPAFAMITGASLLPLVVKMSWDLYREHHQNLEKKALDESFFAPSKQKESSISKLTELMPTIELTKEEKLAQNAEMEALLKHGGPQKKTSQTQPNND